ncbi:Reticulon-like protein B21 [Camellia lanceoleosa]|uniref:Reticulon-like protein B21 n=1 Tax=Camellia lanceoleosa TaxID=1840588 RepID=A0ACC0I765_9ERIC|nr:Reticulon-like protein B21 [Camellia lanceoleosa]
MEVGRRKRTTRNGVVAGSVLESRMKSDEIKGGIKVFNGEEENSEESGDKSLRPKPSPIGVSGKRKTWKSENSDGLQRSPIQIARKRFEINKNLDVQCKELSVSTDGIKKNPVQSKKSRSEQLSVFVDGIERIPIHKMKTRSEESKELNVFVERTERNPNQVRKAKSESQKLIGESDDGFERNLLQLRKVKPESNKALDESVDIKAKLVSNKSLDGPSKNLDGLGDGTGRNSFELKVAKPESNEAFVESIVAIEKSPVGIEETGADETCKECGVCEEKVISSSLSNMDEVKYAPKLVANDDDEDWDEALDEGIEIEIEKKSFDVKKISIPEQKPKQVVNEEKMLHKVQEKPLPISPLVKKQAITIVNHSRIHPTPKKTKPIPMSHGFQRSPETQTGFRRISQTHNKLQSLVDLVMWRDVSKLAFVFGIGTFIIIASSYTKDINISFITVVSYLGLVYLAVIFLFRSIICRGVIGGDDTNQDYVVGEEEAVWLVKMILPYLNEFLLKFTAFFCGDPATTMKLTIMLFVLAKCGSSITIWKIAKLGFFEIFSVPKICKFWIGKLRDTWESCSHKNAVAFGIFALVWNLSSVVARIWAVFMLFVAFRCYQQSLVRDDWVEDEAKCETTCQVQIGGQRQRSGPTLVELKERK